MHFLTFPASLQKYLESETHNPVNSFDLPKLDYEMSQHVRYLPVVVAMA